MDSDKIQPQHNSNSNYNTLFDRQISDDMQLLDSKQNQNSDQKVLILLTGGTIGMFESKSGLKNRKGSFFQFLQENPYFCDPDYTFYNSRDSEFLITPESNFQKRIWFTLHEFDHLIDSSQMTHQNYIQIAEYIQKYYYQFDSFIILHGTDTLAYTASMLSFMLENLKQTIIITGSQIPISFIRNDAFNNLLCSLTIAGHFTIPEVLVVFHNQLFRGNRCKKANATAIEAFTSPNLEPLAQLGINIDIKWNLIYKPTGNDPFRVQKVLCDQVSVIKFNPMISEDFLESVFQNFNTKAIILESYGTGNIPSERKILIDLIKQATDRGVIIINISQCFYSRVEGVYEAGKVLVDMGVIFCSDITSEAALCQLSYLLGQKQEFPDLDVKKLMRDSLKGEMTPIDLGLANDGYHYFFSQALAQVFSTPQEKNDLQKKVLEPIVQYNVIQGNKNALIYLLEQYEDLAKQDYDGRTLLHLAVCKCQENKYDIVEIILKQLLTNYQQMLNQNEQENDQLYDVWFSPIDKNKKTPLLDAILNIEEGNEILIDLMISYKCQLRTSHDIFEDILINSFLDNHSDGKFSKTTKYIQLLIRAEFQDFNKIVTIDNRNLAHLACSFNAQKVLILLKEINFDFNIKDDFNKLPIDYCIQDSLCQQFLLQDLSHLQRSVDQIQTHKNQNSTQSENQKLKL